MATRIAIETEIATTTIDETVAGMVIVTAEKVERGAPGPATRTTAHLVRAQNRGPHREVTGAVFMSFWGINIAATAGIDPSVGDWLCPKEGCGNWNWARRESCNRCSLPK